MNMVSLVAFLTVSLMSVIFKSEILVLPVMFCWSEGKIVMFAVELLTGANVLSMTKRLNWESILD